jgi:hypothetical protein
MSRRHMRTMTGSTREDILREVQALPFGSRVTIQGPVRSGPQNRLMWVLLGCFERQVWHYGRQYPADTWKSIFMHALGKEFDFAPSLDGEEVVALGYHSSELEVPEMSDLIELLFASGAQIGVDFEGAERPEHDAPSTDMLARIAKEIPTHAIEVRHE